MNPYKLYECIHKHKLKQVKDILILSGDIFWVSKRFGWGEVTIGDFHWFIDTYFS